MIDWWRSSPNINHVLLLFFVTCYFSLLGSTAASVSFGCSATFVWFSWLRQLDNHPKKQTTSRLVGMPEFFARIQVFFVHRGPLNTHENCGNHHLWVFFGGYLREIALSNLGGKLNVVLRVEMYKTIKLLSTGMLYLRRQTARRVSRANSAGKWWNVERRENLNLSNIRNWLPKSAIIVIPYLKNWMMITQWQPRCLAERGML